MTNTVQATRRTLSVTCGKNQKLLVGKDVSISVSSTFLRKHDGKPCVRLNIETPQDFPVYKANLMEEGIDVPHQEHLLAANDVLPSDPVSPTFNEMENVYGVNDEQMPQANDTIVIKSNRAGILTLSKTATTMKAKRDASVIEKPLTIEVAAKSFVYDNAENDIHHQSGSDNSGRANNFKLNDDRDAP